jgi:hypothetical protein
MNNEEKILQMLELMQSQIKENTEILKALEHKVDVVKAEQDNFTYHLAELSGDVKSIKSTVVKGEKAYDFLENLKKFPSLDK